MFKTFHKFLLASACLTVTFNLTAMAQDCSPVHTYDGLIFDAASFVAPNSMTARLDGAIKRRVEKIVLFPHPDADRENQPIALEQTFPDQVVRGNQPWSKSAPVIWPEPIEKDQLGMLEIDLENYPTRKFLLSNLSRFDPKTLQRLVKNAPNLWLGLDKNDLDALVSSCAKGPLQEIIDLAPSRIVFASFGGEKNWKYYSYSLKSLHAYAALLSEEQAQAIMYRNAEELYNLAVNAP